MATSPNLDTKRRDRGTLAEQLARALWLADLEAGGREAEAPGPQIGTRLSTRSAKNRNIDGTGA